LVACLAGAVRHFLSAHIAGGQGDTSRASTLPLWWPPTKVAAQHLGVYLETVNDGAVYDGPDDPTAIPVEMHLPTKPAAPFAAPA